MLYIESVEVRFLPDASIWWGKAEREYAASAGAPPPEKQHAESDALPGDSEGDAYREKMDTPEAKAYVRNKLADAIKERLARDVQPKFRGTRSARLEIEVRTFHIPSPLQRVALGGVPTLGAVTILRDSKTGAELGKLDVLRQVRPGMD